MYNIYNRKNKHGTHNTKIQEGNMHIPTTFIKQTIGMKLGILTSAVNWDIGYSGSPPTVATVPAAPCPNCLQQS